MAADQERAARIRQLRIDSNLKWQQIADHAGVRLRSAQMWAETGSISYDNAKKLAALAGVDPDWIMRGTVTSTPDLLDGVLASTDQLDRIEDKLDAILDLLSGEDDGRLDETIRRVRESLRRPTPQSSPARVARTKR